MFHFFRQRRDDPSAINCTDGKPEQETRSLADPAAWLLDLFGATPVNAGVSVSPSNAMRCTPLRAAVSAIAEAVGGLPLFVYEKAVDGARSRATGHPAYALLHDQANDWTPAGAFREQVTRDALLHGNGFGFINRVDNG